MRHMIVCAFWTDERYRVLAHQLFASAHRMGLPTHGWSAPDTGDWKRNTLLRPALVVASIKRFAAEYESILWCDADTVFRNPPEQVENDTEHDAGFRWDGPKVVWPGCTWWRTNLRALTIAETWQRHSESGEYSEDERSLTRTILDAPPTWRLLALPAGYVWLKYDFMNHPAERPVLEHSLVHTSSMHKQAKPVDGSPGTPA